MLEKKITRIGLIILVSIAQAFLTLPSICEQLSATLPSTASQASRFSMEELKSKRTMIEGMGDIDGAVKNSSLAHIDQAIIYLELADISSQKAVELSRLIRTAPERLNQLEGQLKSGLSMKNAPNNIQGTGRLALEQRVQRTQIRLAAAQTALKEWSERLALEKNTIRELPEQIIRKTSRLKEVQTNLGQLSNGGKTDVLNRSRIWFLKAEQAKLTSEIKLKEQRKRDYNLLVKLFRAEQDLARRSVEHLKKRFQQLKDEVQKQREQEAFQASEDARDAILDAPLGPKIVQDQFYINVQLSKELEAVVRDETRLSEEQKAHEASLKTLEDEFETAKKRVDLEMLTEVIGLALRTQSFNLPNVDQYSADSRAQLIRISEISERQIALERNTRELSAPGFVAETLTNSLGNLSDAEQRSLGLKIHEVLTNRMDLIIKLKSGYDRVITLIQDIEFAKKKLVNTAESFGELLERHLIWIPSSKPIQIDYFQKLNHSLELFFSRDYWGRVVKDTGRSFHNNPFSWFIGLLMTTFLFASQRWTVKKMKMTAGSIDEQHEDTFLVTIKTVGLTLFLSVCWPFLLALPAIQLSNLPGADRNSQAFAHGLIYAAIVLLFWIFLYHICRCEGLARAHFQWPESVRKTLKWNLTWLIPIETISAFLVATMRSFPDYEFSDHIATLSILIQSLAISLFFARTLRFKKGITALLIEKTPQSLLCRLRYLWYPFVVLLPLFILWLALNGYYYSSLELRFLVNKTFAISVWVFLLYSLALRALKLARRGVVAKKTAESKALHEKTSSPGERVGIANDGSGPAMMAPTVKMNEIDAHTRSILKLVVFIIFLTCLWHIWDSVFPAFHILQDIHFWSYNTVVNGVEKTVSITLANLVMGGGMVFVTFVAVRNLPGLLEIILLNRLQMDPGARYASSTVCRYAITALGVLIALNAIGIRWSNLQWLAAALSVGLGFGLQEIVANFICGLIVLFERPFRLGDTVTIGEVDGTVTRIQIRATTILDWDRKELIVPNKEFITGRLINWTLSDQVLRIKVPVGLVYGADTDLAEQLMMKAVKSNPLILKTPEPRILFLGFGDNSLDYEARVFIKDIEDWTEMRHKLLKTIDSEFRKAGIIIAFPQQDVHVDLNKPLDIRMVSEEPTRSEPVNLSFETKEEPS